MKKNRKADFILIGAVLLAALLITGYLYLTGEKGAEVVVTVNGAEYARYPLTENMETVIETEYGTNKLVIQDGKADVTEADCPDALCVNMTSISLEGQSIICLPHKLVVQIEGGEASGVDAVVQ